MLAIRKYKFVFDFLQLRSLYPFYNKIYAKSNDQYLFKKTINDNYLLTESIHVVNYIPPFLKSVLDKGQGLGVISFYQFNGFMADLEGYADIHDFMKDKMGSKSRTKMRSYVRKLETCFDITYKLYFGEISIEEYDTLFLKFHSFISRRFQQRGDTHELLEQWEFIKTSSYEMIMNKMASLFVIYNGQEPIDICLNYHYGSIFHNGIRSYDIDYAKFRLGYIDILKQLEWCIANNMQIFDLGLGDMAYKRMWCNVVYDFEHQILYEEKSIYKKMIAIGLVYFYKVKEYLKEKKIHILYHKLRKLGRRKDQLINRYNEPKFEIQNLDYIPELHNTSLISCNHESYHIIKKHIHDFQYLNLERSKDIGVYSSNDQMHSYYILGKKKIQRLILI